MDNTKTGIVYLIGAGPGDAGLITQKAVECLKKSDIIVYDYLVNQKILDHCSADSEKIYVGKKAGHHTLSQDGINDLLVEKAKKGHIVARLKGGDPFVFGRGGEEAMKLVENGIEFEVIPGVTAGIAASAYAGISLTQRGMSSVVSFITGHEDPTKDNSDINWEKLSGTGGTLVFYMGVKNLPLIVNELKKHGMSGNTQAGLVRWGTLSIQESVTGVLDNIVDRVREKNLKPPAIIVVGKVIELREKLRWFDNKPLFGKKIVVTRSRNQASALSRELNDLGANVIELPTIDINPVGDYGKLDDCLNSISEFSWIIFTSVNGVEIFFRRLFKSGMDSRALNANRFAVIGSETGKVLAGYGIKPDLVPERFTSEGVVEEFKKKAISLNNQKVLLPSSNIARDYVPIELRKMGAEIVSVPVYENRTPEYNDEFLNSVFKEMPDLITFTSSSTVSNLVSILEKSNKENIVPLIKGASIGPITSKTAAGLNVPIILEAHTHNIDCLVETITKYFQKKGEL